MNGYIRKRGKASWEITIHLGYDENRKRRVYTETFRGAKRKAEERKADLIVRHSKGDLQRQATLTLSAFLKEWTEEVLRGSVSPRTFDGYRHNLEKHILPALGHYKLSALTPTLVQRFYNDLRNTLSARTVHHIHSVLHRALEKAVAYGDLARNVTKYAELPRIEEKEMLALDSDQARRFIEAAREDRYFVMWILALDSGARPEEYIALQWSDVNFELGQIQIQRVICYQSSGGRGWYFDKPKTPKSRRNIPLSPTTVDLLRLHFELQLEEKRAYEEKRGLDSYNPDNLIFCSTRGTPLHRSNMQKRHFKPVLARAGLSAKINIYTLRHSCATLLLERNVHPKIVQDRLGHSTIRLTLDTYSHVTPGMQEIARDALSDLIFTKKPASQESSGRQLVGSLEE